MPGDLDLWLRDAAPTGGGLDEAALADRVAQLRRRWLAAGMGVATLAVAALVVVVAVVSPSDRVEFANDGDGPSGGPPAAEREPSPATAADGAFVVTAQVDHAQVVAGEPVNVRFTNEGRIEATTGEDIQLEQWAHGQWVRVADWPQPGRLVQMVQLVLRPGTGEELAFGAPTDRLDPGWYRLAHVFEGPGVPAATAHAPFEVVDELADAQQPHGTPAVDGDLDRTDATVDDTLTFAVRNIGDVALEHAASRYTIERWDDGDWVRDPNPSLGSVVQPKQALAPGDTHTMRVSTHLRTPGRYRVTMQYTQPLRGAPRDERPTVTATAEFTLVDR